MTPSRLLDPTTGEPQHGDFVAYLDDLERQRAQRATQVHPDAATSHAVREASNALTPAQAAKVLVKLKATGADSSKLIGALVFSFIGLVMLLTSILGDGGFVLAAIGLVLLANAFATVRKAVKAAGPATGDVLRAGRT